MAEYVITLRVRTDREPRDDPWPQLRKTASEVFKLRPTGPLDLLGATIEQVPSIIERGQRRGARDPDRQG